jgi:hypothetical protein
MKLRLWLYRRLIMWATRIQPPGYSVQSGPVGPVPQRLFDEHAETV